MAPSAKKLEEALLRGTYETYRLEPEATTVNKVRKQVEEDLGLEDGFFSSGQWKSKSKTLIKERVVSYDRQAYPIYNPQADTVVLREGSSMDGSQKPKQSPNPILEPNARHPTPSRLNQNRNDRTEDRRQKNL